MAYAAVTSLMSTLGWLMQFNPPEKQIESLHKKVKQLTQSLREKVSLLQALLKTLEKNINDREEEGKIKIAAHDTEDRIESVLGNIYEAKNKKVRRKAYEKLCKRLQQACQSIDSKCKELKEIMKTTGLQATSSLVQRFEHSSLLDNNMVGHENELEDMKITLMETSSHEMQVVAIIGIGGIGKTTFARRIYDDPAIRAHFDILAWVTMSKEYPIKRMLLQLLQSTKDVGHKATDDGELAGTLKQRLWKRRYLVVVDDIWSTNAWDDISQWFPDCRGSHVILTTRCGNVATYAAPGKPPRHMSSLTPEKSWELLQSKLLEKVKLSPELLKIGKKIAENCHGLPLTITVIAGLLPKYNNALHEWEKVAQDVKSAIFKDPSRQCEKVLALSYYYLPQHLKACFLYFGIFPEDDEVNVTRLFSLWVAEGLLKETDDKSLEQVGEECLQELIDRNLVLLSRHTFCGEVEICKIHDLFHELCLRQAQSENFLAVINNKPPYQTSPPYQASHVSQSFMQVCLMIVRSIGDFHRLHSDSCDQNKIRTLVYQGDHEHIVADNDREKRKILEFENFKMIRVLALRRLCFWEDVPPSLSDLVHLRYLSLSIRSHQFLPLFKLQNLQILIVEIEYSERDHMIPINIWRMPQLRSVHFMKTEWRCPPNMPTGGGSHVVLEHLHTIIGVGPAWCEKEIFALMPNLKKLEVVLDHGAVHPRNLRIATSYLPLVEALKITIARWSSGDSRLWSGSPPHDDVIFVYRSTLPPTLRRLTLCRTCLYWEAMDIVGMLPNLEALELEDNACGYYSGTTWKPTRGVFTRLKFLSLRSMVFFSEWKAIDDHFPVLERFFISHCIWLKEIPQEFAYISTL